jgi:hypothetical protein
MNKIIIPVLILLATSQILSKDPNECGTSSLYSCNTTQTCCQNIISPSGYACFNILNGTCCTDGMSICPFNFVCNLKDKKCDRMALSFLEEVEVSEPNFAAANVQLSSQALDFVLAFVDGFSLFKKVHNVERCQPQDPQIIEDINDVVNIVKNITIHSDFIQLIAEVVPKVTDVYNRIVYTTVGCIALAKEVKQLIDSLKAHVLQKDYVNEVSYHTLFNFGEIHNKIQEASLMMRNGNYTESGRTFGGLVRFVFFSNFKTKSLFLESSSLKIDSANIKDFVLGLNEGFTFFRNLSNFDYCKVSNTEFAADVEELIAILKDLSITNIAKIIPKLINEGVKIINKLAEVSTTCKNLADEVLVVLQNMKNHVGSMSYVSSLIIHTTSNIGEIRNRVKNGENLMMNKQYRESGNAFGDSAKFALFWDFKN